MRGVCSSEYKREVQWNIYYIAMNLSRKVHYMAIFLGGCVVSSRDWQLITDELNAKKRELNLYGEVKWSKVTKNYLNKYIELVDLFFSFIKTGKVKIRIMFQNNKDEQSECDTERPSDRYLRQYYLFIKNAFGLKHLKSEKPIYLRIYLDRLPNDKEKRIKFRQMLMAMPHTVGFTDSPIIIRNGDVAEIRSHEHAILQCMDIILGSMYFRLNNLHLAIPEGLKQRGKRTVAKESLFNHILENIKEMMPDFDVSETTGGYDDEVPECYWNHSYRHWRIVQD